VYCPWTRRPAPPATSATISSVVCELGPIPPSTRNTRARVKALDPRWARGSSSMSTTAARTSAGDPSAPCWRPRPGRARRSEARLRHRPRVGRGVEGSERRTHFGNAQLVRVGCRGFGRAGFPDHPAAVTAAIAPSHPSRAPPPIRSQSATSVQIDTATEAAGTQPPARGSGSVGRPTGAAPSALRFR